MNYKNMSPKQFKAAIESEKDVVILDVRTPQEVAQSSIKGALTIDFMASGFADKIKNLDKSKNYYVYCRSGNRSGQACQLMTQLGFTSLVNLDGGMLAWESAY